MNRCRTQCSQLLLRLCTQLESQTSVNSLSLLLRGETVLTRGKSITSLSFYLTPLSYFSCASLWASWLLQVDSRQKERASSRGACGGAFITCHVWCQMFAAAADKPVALPLPLSLSKALGTHVLAWKLKPGVHVSTKVWLSRACVHTESITSPSLGFWDSSQINACPTPNKLSNNDPALPKHMRKSNPWIDYGEQWLFVLTLDRWDRGTSLGVQSRHLSPKVITLKLTFH